MQVLTGTKVQQQIKQASKCTYQHSVEQASSHNSNSNVATVSDTDHHKSKIEVFLLHACTTTAWLPNANIKG